MSYLTTVVYVSCVWCNFINLIAILIGAQDLELVRILCFLIFCNLSYKISSSTFWTFKNFNVKRNVSCFNNINFHVTNRQTVYNFSYLLDQCDQCDQQNLAFPGKLWSMEKFKKLNPKSNHS